MSVASFESVLNHNPGFIRKGLEGSIFVKRWEDGDAEIVTVYTTSAGLTIPTGYTDVGVITKDQAAEWARDVETSDVESWGYTEPTRRDYVRDTTTLSFTMQESKRQVMELYNNTDYTGVTADADKNTVIDKPRIPETIFWRAFQLAKDGAGADAIYFLRALPRCQVTEIGNQTVGADGEIQYPVTLTGYRDPDWGTAVREIWGGPGYDPAAHGFGVAGG